VNSLLFHVNEPLKRRFLYSLALLPGLDKLRHWNQKKAIILIYHQIRNQGPFEQQIKFITQNCNVIELDQLVSLVKEKKPFPPYSVAITFDDGYSCLYRYAFPVLKAYKCRATIFINTGLVGSSYPIWPLLLRGYIFNANVSSLSIRNGNPPLVMNISNVKWKARAYHRILMLLKHEQHKNLWPILDEIKEATGTPLISWNADDLSLNWNQIREMESSGLIRFGNHTDSHRTLPWVDEGTLIDELNRAEIALVSNTLNPSRVFAFPNGEYDPRADKQLQKTGYIGAVTIKQQFVTLNTDPMRLERIGVNDVDEVPLLILRMSGLLSLLRIFTDR